MRQIASEPVWNGILFADVLESTRETLYLEDTAIIGEEEIVGFVFRKLCPKVYPNLIPRWSRTNVEEDWIQWCAHVSNKNVRRYSFGRRNFNEIAFRNKSILMNLNIEVSSKLWWTLILRPRIRANNQDIRIRYHLCKGLYRLSNDPAYAYNGLLWAADRPAIHNNMLLPPMTSFCTLSRW